MVSKLTQSHRLTSHAYASGLMRPPPSRPRLHLTLGLFHKMATSFATRGFSMSPTIRTSYWTSSLSSRPSPGQTPWHHQYDQEHPSSVLLAPNGHLCHQLHPLMFSVQLQQVPPSQALGPHHFLPIGEQPWDSISMDFIEGLPLSDGNDTILVVVCHLTKMALFIPTFRDIDAKDLAPIFLSQVFAKHGTLTDIVSDWGKHFILRFWRSLCQLLGIKEILSMAYHPETDVQTKWVNQILEQYLR